MDYLFHANLSGIDYMLQAKLADGRAQEAEQKLEGMGIHIIVEMMYMYLYIRNF